MTTNKNRLLVLGAGYLGAEIAHQAIRKQFRVDVLSRNPQTLSTLNASGVQTTCQAYLGDSSWHSELAAEDYDFIVISVGSSESTQQGYQESYIRGIESVLKWSEGYSGKLLYTSSISVYGDANGAEIDESTPPDPRNWRGEIILQSENLLQQHKKAQVSVFRLGGIYGPGRNQFLTSLPPDELNTPTYRHSYLNLIHLKDAAEALITAGAHPQKLDSIYNLTDGNPFTREKLQAYVKTHHPERIQTRISNRKRMASANRQIVSKKIQSQLQWTPNYPTVFDAFRDLV